jgi:hypothetical protein
MKHWQVVKAVTRRIRPNRSEPALEAEIGASSREPPASEEWPPPGPAAELIFIITIVTPDAPVAAEGKPPSGSAGAAS